MSAGKLKFKFDENLPIEAANLFNEFGYDAETVLSEGLQGSTDVALINVCKREGRILITFDLDFSDVRVYSPGAVPGIIVVRLADQSIDITLSVLKKIVSAMKEESPAGKLWIADEKKIRIRENG